MSKITFVKVFFSDVLLISLSVFLSYLLRFDFKITQPFFSLIPYVAFVYSILCTLSFMFFRVYRKIWTYASVEDLSSIFKGTLISSVLFYIFHHFVVFYIFKELVVPRSIYLLVPMITLLVIGTSRFIRKLISYTLFELQPNHRKVLIVGAGRAGSSVYKELVEVKSEYYPVGFIDDNMNKQNQQISGAPILGTRFDIQKVVREYNIEDIIIAMPSASKSEVANIISICKETGCRVKIIPNVSDIINGKISLNMIKNVSVEDLLGREPVDINLEEISGYIKEKVIMITGAGGSIGSELSRQIASYEPSLLILLGHGENSIYEIEMELKRKCNLAIIPVIADIQDRERIQEVFSKYRPEVVFHAAAHKHVPLMEGNPFEAIKNNVFGTKNLAECADKYNVKRFVMISTDKAVNPSNIMGVTKKIAEMMVQGLDSISQTQFSAVRFGNVLGSRGSVIPLFKRQIEEGGPVTVTHPEMVRYFMTINEAVKLVIQAGALATGGEIFILDMGKPVKISDLAHDLVRLSGLEPNKDVNIIYTGIRPGEKLYEEIFTHEEGGAATKHDRIYVGKRTLVSYDELEFYLRKLEQLIHKRDFSTEMDLTQLLKQIVPTYKQYEFSGALANDEAYKASQEILATIDHSK